MTVKKKKTRAMDFAMVREIGMALPGVVEVTAWGVPALKVNGEMMACVPTHKSAEPGSLVVRIGMEERAGLLAERQDAYYVTEHYVGYTAVLVRMVMVQRGELRDLLRVAHRFATGLAGKRKGAKNKSGGRD